MHYDTKFNAKLAIWTDDAGLGKLPLPYELVHETYAGEKTVGGREVDRHSFAYQFRKEHDGCIETAVSELCESLGGMDKDHIEALANNGENWIVIGLLDKDFVEIHFRSELQDAMAKFRLSISVENRTKSE